MKIILFGGTGGLGSALKENLTEHECISVGSKLCDVTDEQTVKELVERVDPDVIVYLSVKNIDGLIHKQIQGDIVMQFAVNSLGFLNVLKSCTEKMRAKKFGRVIYISSVMSTCPIRGTGIYSATKAFSDSIIRTYALENSKYGITANSIQLGYFEVGLVSKVPPLILESVIKDIPLKRLGRVTEFASMVRQIIDNEYLNGANIRLNGGYENQ